MHKKNTILAYNKAENKQRVKINEEMCVFRCAGGV
jgi:hypothetical protein